MGCGVVKALRDFDGQIAQFDLVETGDVAVDVVDVAVFVARISVVWALFLELGGDGCEQVRLIVSEDNRAVGHGDVGEDVCI